MSDSPRPDSPAPSAAQTVREDQVVSLAYVLRDSDGEVLDSAGDDSPLEYIHGYGQIIPGLEDELYGMAIDDEKDVVVEPEVGYGIYDPEANQIAPLDMFPEGMDLEIGLPVDVYDDEADEPTEAFIAEIYDDGVLLDFNHPLAGETLHFHVKVVGLRDATTSEIDHGHVHGAGHDHH